MNIRHFPGVSRALWAVLPVGVMVSLACLAWYRAGVDDHGVRPERSATNLATRTASRTPSPEPVRIGAVFDLGKTDGEVGRRQWEGARLAVDELNARGGIQIADTGRRPIELIAYDDDGRPEQTILVTRRLVQDDGVVAVVGPSDSRTAPFAAAEAGRHEAPVVSPALTEPQRGGSEARWSFSVAPRDEDALTLILDIVVGFRLGRIGWIAPRTASADAVRANLIRQVDERGLRIVAEESYGVSEGEVGDRATRLAQAGADAIVGWPRSPEDAAIVAKAVSERAKSTRLFLGPRSASDRFLTLAGEAAYGARAPVPRLLLADELWDHDPLTPAIREFIRAYRLKYGYAPSVEAAAGWDAVRVVVDAIVSAGVDRRSVRDAIERLDSFPGSSGFISFSPDNHFGLDRRAPLVARAVPGGWRIPP